MMLDRNIKWVVVVFFLLVHFRLYSQDISIGVNLKTIEITTRSVYITYSVSNNTNNTIWLQKDALSPFCVVKYNSIQIVPVNNYSPYSSPWEGIGFVYNDIGKAETSKIEPGKTIIAAFYFSTAASDELNNFTQAKVIDLNLTFLFFDITNPISFSKYRSILESNAIFIRREFKIP